jgi:hypothetical protein
VEAEIRGNVSQGSNAYHAQSNVDYYLTFPPAESNRKNARTFFRLFRKHTNCNVKAHEFNQSELERFV